MGRLSSLANSCRSIGNLPYLLADEEYKRREPELRKQFESLREDIQKGKYTTGDRMFDFCFLAESRDVGSLNGWPCEYRECAEELNKLKRKLRNYHRQLVLYETEDEVSCGRIARYPLKVDIQAMTLSINTGGVFAVKQDHYWRIKKGDIVVLDANEYDRFDIVDLTSDLDIGLIGDEAVRERLGDELNHVTDLLMPIPKQQRKLPF